MSFEVWSNKKKKEREEEEKKSSQSLSSSTNSSNTTEETPSSFAEWSNKKHGGKKGWEKYLADQESTEQKETEEKENEPWWMTLLGYLGPTGPADTTLPLGNTAQIVHDVRNDTSYTKPSDDWSDEQRYEFGALYLESPEKAYAYAERLIMQITRQ